MEKEYANVTLDDFTRVRTIGMGSFGRVELVSYQHDVSNSLGFQ